MKYLGLDYGAKRIGVAVSDEEGTIAFPRGVEANDGQALARLAAFAKEEQIGSLIVGDTRTFSGAANTVTEEAETFARELSLRTAIPVRMVSEAWSSREAGRFAPARARRAGGPKEKKDDSSAAAFILQRFLDMRQSKK